MKTNSDDLAIYGAAPAFHETLHVGRPNIGDRKRFYERIDDMLNRRWLSNNGPYVQEFEQRVAEMIGVRHCIAMCNGTIALEIAIRALELKGEVILPSFTFVATAHALQWQEITPVFCDVDPATHTIDPACIEKMITPRTTGIIGVHVWGRPCAIEALEQIAGKHRLKLLFDAAHGFGCSRGGRMLGSFGNAEVFSFHPTKFFNTGEGGAIATNDDALAQKIRLMKNFGFSGKHDDVIYVGTNGKMSELSALTGLTNLESIAQFIAVNCENYETYREELAGLPGISLISYDQQEKCNYQYVVLEIDEQVTGIGRDRLVEILRAENVLARRYFYPGCHRMEPYRSYFPNAGLLLPHTERLTTRVLSLPTGTAVSQEDIREICRIIRIALSQRPEEYDRLNGSLAVASQAGDPPQHLPVFMKG
ncbi:DegT/DnrJ/EryC1/StrS family aminotransferase [Trichlorobacter ammonificans]|uniref:DegT/DnrJ/EryC1/StrS aminotransferase n=1 Tax=Trichlorobacter ammonificans TaxID=2916410 RepID=A0ABN8HEW9_9BACT|nr:DegT/DnrJ/EryC1/StrS family aminotransferase [Trichlorobacter ammonificans]CAH2031349.1 DegT/DnrJ/EryC1/StrS aminotransferase [Trichlorobacter ammonificans]